METQSIETSRETPITEIKETDVYQMIVETLNKAWKASDQDGAEQASITIDLFAERLKGYPDFNARAFGEQCRGERPAAAVRAEKAKIDAFLNGLRKEQAKIAARNCGKPQSTSGNTLHSCLHCGKYH